MCGFPDGSAGKESTCQCRICRKHRFDPWLGKEMVTHSNTLAWRIPRIEEPGVIQSMGSQRVGHDLWTEHNNKYMQYVCVCVQYLYMVVCSFTYYTHTHTRASLVAQLGKNICLQCRRPKFNSWVGKIPWRMDRLPTIVFLGFPGASDSKESTCNARDLCQILVLRRSPGGGHGNPLQYSSLQKSHGQRSLAGYSPQGRKVSDTTEQLNTAQHIYIYVSMRIYVYIQHDMSKYPKVLKDPSTHT